MHDGLIALSWLVRSRAMRSLVPLARPLQWIADRLKPFGTDRGAMQVTVRGTMADGTARQHRWTVVAEAGDGPQIPPTPAYLLARRLIAGDAPPDPGARPCLGELALGEVEAGFAPYAITAATTSSAIAPLFETALGARFTELPDGVRRLHAILDRDTFAGTASVERGTHPLARLIGWMMGFPTATSNNSVRVEMIRTGDTEAWTRTFSTNSFRSHLSIEGTAGSGVMRERFGALYFTLPLSVDSEELHFPVARGYLGGFIPLPKAVLPISEAREFIDDQGRTCFDVAVSLRWVGRIVRYKGWLVPVAAG